MCKGQEETYNGKDMLNTHPHGKSAAVAKFNMEHKHKDVRVKDKNQFTQANHELFMAGKITEMDFENYHATPMVYEVGLARTGMVFMCDSIID